MKTSITNKQIWNIAWPIILSSVAQNIINITDTAFLGRLSELALGASAIGGVFYFVFIFFGFGFGVGSQIIIARRMGENQPVEAGKTAMHSWYFLFAFSVIMFCLMYFVTPPILKNVLSSSNVFLASNEYLSWRAWGIFFAFINTGFRAFYVGIGKTKILTFSTLFMAGINVILDYGFIFGNWGFPAWGIQGAAIASVIAEISATLFFIAFTLKAIPYKKFHLFKFIKPQKELSSNLLRVSTPMMMQNFISLGAWFSFFLLVEKLGEHALAISNVIRSLYILLLVPIWGFSTASNSLTSFLIGQGKHKEVIPLIFKSLKLCLLLVIPIVLFVSLIPFEFISLVTNDKDLINDSVPVLYLILAATVLLAVASVVFQTVSGTGKTLTSLIIETSILVVYLFYVYILTIHQNSSVEWVWTSEYLYSILLGLVSFIYLKSGKWIGAKV